MSESATTAAPAAAPTTTEAKTTTDSPNGGTPKEAAVNGSKSEAHGWTEEHAKQFESLLKLKGLKVISALACFHTCRM